MEFKNYRAIYGKGILHTHIDKYRLPPGDALPGPVTGIDPHTAKAAGPIAIIGAGASGLAAAYMLKTLGYSFEIFEASDRVGGRCFTYYFDDKKTQYNYYDVGAMRFPNVPAMDTTFEWFDRLQIQLDPYIFKAPNAPLDYNGHTFIPPDTKDWWTTDIFKVGTSEGGTVTDQDASQSPDNAVDAAFADIAATITADFQKGWTELLNLENAGVSVRDWFLNRAKRPRDNPTVSWFETYEFGTLMYNASFTENLLDYLEFGDASASTNPSPQRAAVGPGWFLVRGGTQVFTDTLFNTLDITLESITNKRVTKISKDTGSADLLIDVEGTTQPTPYSHVISTIPLGSLETVTFDDNIGLNWGTRTAIRSCAYADSVKVAIKFHTRWWQNAPVNIKGGLDKTDRPTRCVVFPSYGIDDDNAPAVMIASYNWSQDAARFGALIQGPDSQEEKQLVFEIILRDIAAIHQVDYNNLSQNEYMAHHAWHWGSHPYTRGAFAFFQPGQFSEMFPFITQPGANGRLHFAGEAASVHHAWVAGALTSAWRAVAEVLIIDGSSKEDAENKLVNLGFKKPEEVDVEIVLNQLKLSTLRL